MSVPADKIYDIAVIGGGVNGCGIARDAAGRGAKVLLLEAGDLAGDTSSASTNFCGPARCQSPHGSASVQFRH